ncbi:hypothetical protein I4200191B4_14740 [Pseudoflavonifractor gallinarum]
MYTNQLKITLILYKKWILPVEETTSGGADVASFLRPFHALRQPVQVTGCRGAFFYLWKGVKKYESKLHLPRLWDLFGL